MSAFVDSYCEYIARCAPCGWTGPPCDTEAEAHRWADKHDEEKHRG